MMYGYDISNHQAGLSIVSLSPRAEFVIAKVTQDESFIDMHFGDFRSQARQLEIGFGGYHFADMDFTPDPEESCDFFINNLGEQQEGEIAALDLEAVNVGTPQEPIWHNLQPDQLDWTVGWGRRFIDRTGYKPYLYLARSWITEHNLDHPVIESTFRLWYAYWTDAEAPPFSPSPWDDYDLWQYNADGLDKNKFFGALADFKATGKPVPGGTGYEELYWTPIQKLLDTMAAGADSHADDAFHASVSNSITLHKIARGVEQP